MKRILYLLFLIIPFSIQLKAQETPPAGIKSVNGQFYINLPDSSIWQQKGSPYNFHRVAKYKDIIKARSYTDSTSLRKRDSKYQNILTWGGSADGVTDNTTAFTTAKNAGMDIIYFPQNATNNAKYFFGGAGPLYLFSVTIDADPGVIISAPYFSGGENGFTSSNVALNIRSIGDTAFYYADIPTYKQLHINDADYDKSKILPINNNKITVGAFNWGLNTGPAFEGSLVDTSRIKLNSAVATGTLNYAGYNIGIGDEINGNFTGASAGTNSGAFVRFTDGSWIYFNNGGTSGFGTYAYHYKPAGGVFLETTVNKPLGFANDYYLSYGITRAVITIRKVSNTMFAIMINGKEFFERFDYGKTIDLVGFANYNTAATSIIENITTVINKVSQGRTNVRIDGYGDSKFAPGKQTIEKVIKEAVNHTNGVRIQSFNNYAVSGNDFKDQYNVFLTKGVANTDVVIVSLATNNIQNGNVADTAIKYLNLFNNVIVAQKKKLMVIVPTLWYSYALAGNTGQNTLNYELGSPTRGAIAYWCSQKNVKCVNLSFTTPEAIFNKSLMTDNIHPQAELNRINGIEIAKAFMSMWETENEPIEPNFSQYAKIARRGAVVDSLTLLGKTIVNGSLKADSLKVKGSNDNFLLTGGGGMLNKSTLQTRSDISRLVQGDNKETRTTLITAARINAPSGMYTATYADFTALFPGFSSGSAGYVNWLNVKHNNQANNKGFVIAASLGDTVTYIIPYAATDTLHNTPALPQKIITNKNIATEPVITNLVPKTFTIANFPLNTNVTLAGLTATDPTLNFSGAYNGSTARTVGLNLANANNWTGAPTYTITSVNDNIFQTFVNNSGWTPGKLNNQIWRDNTNMIGAIGMVYNSTTLTADFVINSLYNTAYNGTSYQPFVFKGNGDAIFSGKLTALLPAYSSGANLPVVYNSTNNRFETSTLSNVNATQTTVLGTTGSIIASMPFQGASYKKVILYCNPVTGSAIYTFPTPFTNLPVLISPGGTVSAMSTTSVTITNVNTAPFIILEGY